MGFGWRMDRLGGNGRCGREKVVRKEGEEDVYRTDGARRGGRGNLLPSNLLEDCERSRRYEGQLSSDETQIATRQVKSGVLIWRARSGRRPAGGGRERLRV